MTVFERTMKQTLNYDKFLDAVYRVRYQLISAFIFSRLLFIILFFSSIIKILGEHKSYGEMDIGRYAMYRNLFHDADECFQ